MTTGEHLTLTDNAQCYNRDKAARTLILKRNNSIRALLGGERQFLHINAVTAKYSQIKAMWEHQQSFRICSCY